jgi:uncharacterized DUF497 family protein
LGKVKVSFSPSERDITLVERNLEFADNSKAFDDPSITLEDHRFAYPKPRILTYGMPRIVR